MINSILHRYLLFLLCVIFMVGNNDFAFGQTIEFFGCAGIPWVTDSTTTHDGDTTLRSGPIECSGSSVLCGRVKGPVDISFWWKNGAYPKIGQLLFEINGTKIFECDSRDWKQFTYPLSDDQVYTLKWTFRRISSYPKWEGSAWLAGIDTSGMPTILLLNSKKSTQATVPGSSGPAIFSETGSIPRQNISAAETSARYFAGKNVTIAPNITVVPNITVIPNITIIPVPLMNNPEKAKSPLIARLLWPEDESFFDLFAPIKFEFRVNFGEKIPLCTWFIDGNEVNNSRSLYKSGSIAFTHAFAEAGMHSWNVNCCDCMERCNSSEKHFFYVQPYNNTTYVDQYNPDPSRFIYSNIKDAVDNLSPDGIVVVENGSYPGSIFINKPLKLIGNNSPVIDLLGKDEFGIVVGSDRVEISGFVIKNSLIGIQADGKKDKDKQLQEINLNNNKILNCMVGISLINCYNASLTSNIVDNFRRKYDLINGDYKDLNALWFENVSGSIVSNNTINKMNRGQVVIETCLHITKIQNIVFKENNFYNSISLSNDKSINQSLLRLNSNEFYNIMEDDD